MQQLVHYFKEVLQELKKVSWPNRRQTLSLTGLVVGITVFVAAYISGLDYLFKNMMALIINS